MKVVFLDADGTLHGPDGIISQGVRQALAKAKSRGTRLVLCTGRQMTQIRGDLASLPYDGIISGAGAHVETGGRVLHDQAFTPEQARCLDRLLQTHHMQAFWETPHALYARPETIRILEQMQAQAVAGLDEKAAAMHGLTVITSQIQAANSLEMTGANKLVVFETPLSWQQTWRQLPEDFSVVPLSFKPLGSNGCEISPREVSKKEGARIICAHFGIERPETIAIGDSENDIPVLEWAGTGCAMGNGSASAKKAASLVGPSLQEDGVARILEALGLA